MQFSDLEFQNTNIPKGIQSVVNFGEYELSIVRNSSSYGTTSGLYEIAVFKHGEQTSLDGVTEDYDSVKGFLTENEVSDILLKMTEITQNMGEQV